MVTFAKEPPKSGPSKEPAPSTTTPPGGATNVDAQRDAAVARARMFAQLVPTKWRDATQSLFEVDSEPPKKFTPEMFRSVAYDLLLDETKEDVQPIREALHADEAHDKYRVALDQAQGDINADSGHVAALDSALKDIIGGSEVKFYTRDILAHFALLTAGGKRWYPKTLWAITLRAYIEDGRCTEHGALELSLTPVAKRKGAHAQMLAQQGAVIRQGACRNLDLFLKRGAVGIVVPDAVKAPADGTATPTVADAVTTPDDGSEAAAVELERRIVEALEKAKPNKHGTHKIPEAVYKPILEDIEKATPAVKDKLYGKPGITQKLVALGDVAQAKEIIGSLDTVEALFVECTKSAPPPTAHPGHAPPPHFNSDEVASKIQHYLAARPGKENYAARARVLQHEHLMTWYVNRLMPAQRTIVMRMIATGSDAPSTADLVRLAAQAGSAAAAAKHLMKMASAENSELQALRDDHLFRLEIEKLDKEVQVDGFPVNPYHLCLTMWGLQPLSTKDPGVVERQTEVNPDGVYKPLKIDERMQLEQELLEPAARALRSEIAEWEVDDDDMKSICQNYERKAATEPYVKYLRQLAKPSGPALVEYYTRLYPNKNLRYEVSEYVSGSERIECERILGFRAMGAAVGQIAGEAKTLLEDPGAPPKVMGLEQALRETIDPFMQQPVGTIIHDLATRICDSWMRPSYVMGFQVNSPGISPDALIGQWVVFHGIITRNSYNLSKWTQIPREKIHAIELLQNAVMEQGGDLAQKVSAFFADGLFTTGRAPEILRAMGLTPQAAQRRAQAAQAALMQKDPEKAMAEKAQQDWAAPAQSLFTRISTMRPTVENATPVANDLKHWIGQVMEAPTVAGPATASIEERPPRSFKGFYRLEFGVDPTLHVARILRSHRDNDTNIVPVVKVFTDVGLDLSDLSATGIVAPKGDVLEITDANRFLVRHDFTKEIARARAADIWKVLHDGGQLHLIVTKLYSDYTTEEQRLIRMAFRELSGGLDLQFYIQQAMAKSRGGLFDGVQEIGGKGTDKADGVTKDTSLELGGDMNKLQTALTIARDGKLDSYAQFRSAVNTRDIDQLFRVTDDAEQADREKILGDRPLMHAARQICDAVAWDRVFKTLTNQSDLTDRLYSRAHGAYDSWNPFDSTDESGMKNDIKAYVKRLRRQFDRQIRKEEELRRQAKQPTREPDRIDAEVESKVKEACHKLMANPDVRKIIEEELSNDDLSQTEGLIINKGEASTQADVARAGVDAAEIIAGIRNTPPDKRAALRRDPAYIEKLAARLINPEDMRAAMDALMSDRSGEDKFGTLDKHATKRESRELLRDLVDLDEHELTRLTKDPALMSKILLSFDDEGERALARQILAMRLPDISPPTANGENQGVRIEEAEKRRLEFCKQNALARLRLPGADGLGWATMLDQAVAVYQLELEPRVKNTHGYFEQESDGELEGARGTRMTEGKKARKSIWALVEDEVTRFAQKAAKDKPKVTQSDVWDAGTMVTVIRKAVLKEADPSGERLKNNLGSKYIHTDPQTGIESEQQHTTSMEGLKASITQASPEQYIKEWSNILVTPVEGKGPTLAAVYQDYKTAKAAAKQANTEDSRALLDKKLTFMNYRIDVSKRFEDTILPSIGASDERTATSDGGASILKDRENKKYNELRDLARDRLASITKGSAKRQVASAIHVEDQEDIELLDNPNRDAIAGFSNRSSKYAFSRGLNAGSGWAADKEAQVVDQSMANYGNELAESQVNREGGYGIITKGEGAKVEEKGAEFDRALQAFKDAKAKVAFWASMIIGVLVTAILTILTGGLATGPLAALFFTTAIAGVSAAAKAGVNEIVMGEDYEFKDEGVKMIGREMLTAFITAGTTMIAQKLVSTVSSAGTLARQARAAEGVMRQPPPLLNRFIAEAGEEVLSETMSGTIEAGLVAIDPEHWMHGVAEGRDRALPAAYARLSAVPMEALKAGVTAVVTSGVMTIGKKERLHQVAREAGPTGGRVNLRENFKNVFGNNKERVMSAFVEWAVDKGFKGKIGNLEDVPADLLEGFLSEVGEASQETHLGTANAARRKKRAAKELELHKDVLNPDEQKAYAEMAGEANASDPHITVLDFARARERLAIDAVYSWAERTGTAMSTAQAKVYVTYVRQAIGPDEFQARLHEDPADVIKKLDKSGQLQPMLDAQAKEKAKADKERKGLEDAAAKDPQAQQEQAPQGTSIETPGATQTQAGGAPVAHNRPAIVTKVDNIDKGHAIMRMLAAGDAAILAQFGFQHEGKTDAVEWGLGQMPDGTLYIVRGDAGSVDFKKIPGMVALAHSHPAELNGESRGLTVANSANGVSIDTLLLDTTNTDDLVRFLPSFGDLGFFADENIGTHVVFTPYVHLGGKQVGNPTDPQSIPPAKRIEIVVKDSHLAGRSSLVKHAPAYGATIIVRTGDGTVLWTGPMYQTRPYPNLSNLPSLTPKYIELGMMPSARPKETTDGTETSKVAAGTVDTIDKTDDKKLDKQPSDQDAKDSATTDARPAKKDAPPLPPPRHVHTEFGDVLPNGPIPARATDSQRDAFEAANRLYDKLEKKSDGIYDVEFARLVWANALREGGVVVNEGLRDAGNQPHVKTASDKLLGRQTEQPHNVAEQVVAEDKSLHRSKTGGEVKLSVAKQAFAELANAPTGFKVVEKHLTDNPNDPSFIVVELADKQTLKIKMQAPGATPGGMAGMRHDGGEVFVWVSDTITDDQVSRALGGIIGVAIAGAKHGKTADLAQASAFGQLEAMFVRLTTLAQPQTRPEGGDTIDNAIADSKHESPARIYAEIDAMMMRLGAYQPGDAQTKLIAQMSPQLQELVKKHLQSRKSLGFEPTAQLTPDKVAQPQQIKDALPASDVFAPLDKDNKAHATRPYGEADQQTVLDLKLAIQTLAEIDQRIKARDRKETSDPRRGALIAQGETMRRREVVARVQTLLGQLQLRGLDSKYYELRLAELEAVIPGAMDAIGPFVQERLHQRSQANDAKLSSIKYQDEAKRHAEKIEGMLKSASDPFLANRLVIGDGSAGLSNLATLPHKPGDDGWLDPHDCLVVGGLDLVARMANSDPSMKWGQRAGLFDPENPTQETPGQQIFSDGNKSSGELRGAVEDEGEFASVGELSTAMDLARKRMGVARVPAVVMKVELRSKHEGMWPVAANGHEVRVTLRFSDGSTKQVYLHHTDITTGIGNPLMPHESILSKEDNEQLRANKAIGGGEEVMTGRPVENKRVLVMGYGPTGGWAAVEAKRRGASNVDWAGSAGVLTQGLDHNADSGAKGLAGLKGIDRVAEAFDPKEGINITSDRILSIKAKGDGAIVTFVRPTEGGGVEKYTVEYDLIIGALPGNNTGKETTDSPQGEVNAGTMIAGIDMRAQGMRSDGSEAPVLESSENGEGKDGAVRVIGAAAGEGVGVSAKNLGAVRGRQKSIPLSADSPDHRVFEHVGEAAKRANMSEAETYEREKREDKERAEARRLEDEGAQQSLGTAADTLRTTFGAELSGQDTALVGPPTDKPVLERRATDALIGLPLDAISPTADSETAATELQTKGLPRWPELTAAERAAETEFAAELEGAMPRKVDDLLKMSYDADNKRWDIEVDGAKKLYSKYGADKAPKTKEQEQVRLTTNHALHPAAVAVARLAFLKALEEVAKLDKDDPRRRVFCTNGGCAAGKNSLSDLINDTKPGGLQYGVKWDAAGEGDAQENSWLLAAAASKGVKITFGFVENDPQNTYDAVLKRAEKSGRIVDPLTFTRSYVRGSDNMREFLESPEYKAAKEAGLVETAGVYTGRWDENYIDPKTGNRGGYPDKRVLGTNGGAITAADVKKPSKSEAELTSMAIAIFQTWLLKQKDPEKVKAFVQGGVVNALKFDPNAGPKSGEGK